MSLYELNKVSKSYPLTKDKVKYVLKDVTLSFPNAGLVSILGKSGSGKSTLLNLLGKLDTPSSGTIYFNNENINKFKDARLNTFRNSEVSYIFQHYHLLENQTAIYNVMLPALIKGDKYKEAKEKAIKLLKSFSINEELFEKRCSNLSGGEKERIAVLRAFINNPKVILADEPTGALDKHNSLLVMDSLKEISKHSLVILVTHNEKLAYQYSDRIIKMKDGKVYKNERFVDTENHTSRVTVKKNKDHLSWFNKIMTNNFVKRFKRNIFSVSALTIGLLASMLIFGFSNGAHLSIEKSAQKQFDYGVASINKENKIKAADSPITLIQTMRPNEDEISELRATYDYFHYCYSYDSLLTPYPKILINDKEINKLSFLPIYSFVDESIDKSVLIEGKIPAFDTLNQVVINKTAYQYLKKETKSNAVGSFIRIKEEKSFSFLTTQSEHPYVTDYFTYDRTCQIVGVVNEMSFLNTPKIYYSYKALDKYMDEVVLNNYSQIETETSWKEMVISSLDNDLITSYSYRLFLKDIEDIDKLKKTKETLDESYSMTSNALTVEETLFSLVDAASIGMEVFLFIALGGTVMILGIISYASYSEDKKDSAILLSLGAKRDDVTLLYICENTLLGIIGLFISFILAISLTKPINLLIEHFTSLIDIIDIPFLSFKGHAFLLPILISMGTLLVCLLSTYLPISFSKKISLKEELNSND